MRKQDEGIQMFVDDMPPEREQEIAALIEGPNQNQVLIAAPSRLQMERELERRKAIYRALMIGYTVKAEKFKEPEAQRVLPNPRNKKPQEPLTPEQERRLARIKKNLRKR